MMDREKRGAPFGEIPIGGGAPLAAIAGPFLADALLIVPLTTNVGAWFGGATLFSVLLVAIVGALVLAKRNV